MLGSWLSGCPGVDPPGVVDDGVGSAGSTTGGPNITTFNSTVDPTLPPDGGSMEAGWMQLIAALQAAIQEDEPHTPEDSHGPT